MTSEDATLSAFPRSCKKKSFLAAKALFSLDRHPLMGDSVLIIYGYKIQRNVSKIAAPNKQCFK
jgi:hypothetical protein